MAHYGLAEVVDAVRRMTIIYWTNVGGRICDQEMSEAVLFSLIVSATQLICFQGAFSWFGDKHTRQWREW